MKPQPHKQSSRQRSSRRRFVKGAALSGVAIGSGLASQQTLAELTEPEHTQSIAKDGYRESAHVRRYYQLARF